MNNEELEKSVKEIEDKIKKNDEIIESNEEKANLTRINQNSYNLILTIGFSLVTYILLLFTSALNNIMLSLSIFVAPEFLPPMAIIGSLGIGTIGRKLLQWKFKTKKLYKSFAKARNNSERIYEEWKYNLELEKALNKRDALNSAVEELSVNSTNIFEADYNVVINDYKAEIEELQSNLEVQYKKIDILTSQKAIKIIDESIKSSKRESSVEKIAFGVIIGGIVTLLFGYMSLIEIRDLLSGNYISAYIAASFALGFESPILYKMKSNRDTKKAFNILKKELGEDALTDEMINTYSQAQFNTEIEHAIADIAVSEAKLQIAKRALETINTKDNNDEHEEQNTFSMQNVPVYVSSELTASDEPKEDKGISLVKKKRY